jgi:hypothetical protein
MRRHKRDLNKNIEQGIMNFEFRRKKLHNSTFLVRHSYFNLLFGLVHTEKQRQRLWAMLTTILR